MLKLTRTFKSETFTHSEQCFIPFPKRENSYKTKGNNTLTKESGLSVFSLYFQSFSVLFFSSYSKLLSKESNSSGKISFQNINEFKELWWFLHHYNISSRWRWQTMEILVEISETKSLFLRYDKNCTNKIKIRLTDIINVLHLLELPFYTFVLNANFVLES